MQVIQLILMLLFIILLIAIPVLILTWKYYKKNYQGIKIRQAKIFTYSLVKNRMIGEVDNNSVQLSKYKEYNIYHDLIIIGSCSMAIQLAIIILFYLFNV